MLICSGFFANFSAIDMPILVVLDVPVGKDRVLHRLSNGRDVLPISQTLQITKLLTLASDSIENFS